MSEVISRANENISLLDSPIFVDDIFFGTNEFLMLWTSEKILKINKIISIIFEKIENWKKENLKKDWCYNKIDFDFSVNSIWIIKNKLLEIDISSLNDSDKEIFEDVLSRVYLFESLYADFFINLDDYIDYSFRWNKTTPNDLDAYGKKIPFEKTINPIEISVPELSEWQKDAYEKMLSKWKTTWIIIDPINQYWHQKVFFVKWWKIMVFPISTGRWWLSNNRNKIESGTCSPYWEYHITWIVWEKRSWWPSVYGGRHWVRSKRYYKAREISHYECIRDRLTYYKLSPDVNWNYDSAYANHDGGMTNTLFTLSWIASVDYLHGTTTRKNIWKPDSHWCLRMLDEHIVYLRKEWVGKNTYINIINPADYNFEYNVKNRKWTKEEEEPVEIETNPALSELWIDDFVSKVWKPSYETDFWITKEIFDAWGWVFFERRTASIDFDELDVWERIAMYDMMLKWLKKWIMVNRNKNPTQILYFDVEKNTVTRMIWAISSKWLWNIRSSYKTPTWLFKVFRKYDNYKVWTTWSWEDGVMKPRNRSFIAPKTSPTASTFTNKYNRSVGWMWIMTSRVIAITEYSDDINNPTLDSNWVLKRDIFFHWVSRRDLLIKWKNMTAGCLWMADENIIWLSRQIDEWTYIYIPKVEIYE